MRKLYNEPEMNISVFDSENIVTEASGATPKSAAENAQAALTDSGATQFATVAWIL